MRKIGLLAGLVVLAVGGGRSENRAAAPENPQDNGIRLGWADQDGTVLFGELNCAACHAAGAASRHLLQRPAPDLRDVGRRATPEYLKAFLNDPHRIKPGSPMPDLTRGLKDRAGVIESLTHYLASLGGPIPPGKVNSDDRTVMAGETLYHTVGCVACHEPFSPPPKLHEGEEGGRPDERRRKPSSARSISIPLGDLASKTTVDELARFLQDPHQARPSGRMPSMRLAPDSAAAIAAYLVRAQPAKPAGRTVGLHYAVYEGEWAWPPDFSSSVTSGAGITRVLDEAGMSWVGGSLSDRDPRLQYGLRFRGYLEIPAEGGTRIAVFGAKAIVTVGGRTAFDSTRDRKKRDVESLTLSKGRHVFEIRLVKKGAARMSLEWIAPGATGWRPIPWKLFSCDLVTRQPTASGRFTLDRKLAERGRRHFATLGCAACHVDKSLPDEAPKAPELADLDGASGCLAEPSSEIRVRFDLNAAQRGVLRRAVAQLKKAGGVPAAGTRVHRTLSAMNCYACHSRKGRGGPAPERDGYFLTVSPIDLGDEGRRAPSLDVTGAKLTREGLESILFTPVLMRPHMAVRMPHFGKAALESLPAAWIEADAGAVPGHEPESSEFLAEQGRVLVGRDGLRCITCHPWGDHSSTNLPGVDLARVAERLRPGWFRQWLLNPAGLKPGTRMPTFWARGRITRRDILHGNTDHQVDAIWNYLAAGANAPPPPGISTTKMQYPLVPEGEPLVMRTALEETGAHSILVGFPEGTHHCFDADRVRMILAWSGDFVSGDHAWDGKGGRYGTLPTDNVLRFPEGPPFARLPSADSSWPADVPKDIKNRGARRTPPGYRYRGYRYDAKRTPTFLYSFGPADIEETPGARASGEEAHASRRFRVTARQDLPDLHFRVLSGKAIRRDAGGGYRIDGKIVCRIEAGDPAKPAIRDSGTGKELLLHVPLKRGAVAEFEIEVTW